MRTKAIKGQKYLDIEDILYIQHGDIYTTTRNCFTDVLYCLRIKQLQGLDDPPHPLLTRISTV